MERFRANRKIFRLAANPGSNSNNNFMGSAALYKIIIKKEKPDRVPALLLAECGFSFANPNPMPTEKPHNKNIFAR